MHSALFIRWMIICPKIWGNSSYWTERNCAMPYTLNISLMSQATVAPKPLTAQIHIPKSFENFCRFSFFAILRANLFTRVSIWAIRPWIWSSSGQLLWGAHLNNQNLFWISLSIVVTDLVVTDQSMNNLIGNAKEFTWHKY